MINFEFKKPFDIHYEGTMEVSLSHEYSDYLKDEQLPIRALHKSLSGEVLWSSDLFPGCWSFYSMLTYTTFEAIDSLGNTLFTWKWNAFEHGDVAHQIFEVWSLNNRGSNGVAIGTHNGMTGEWVGPVNKGLLKATLIEASDKQFSDLTNFYEGKDWVTCKQDLVTTNGEDVTFYEGGAGWTNSIVKESIVNYVNENYITETKRSSTSINDVFEEAKTRGDIKWLHIDVEGLDDYLILSLNEAYLPEIIVYEIENLSQERNQTLVDYLNNKGYRIINSGRNAICIKDRK